jgi:hypothetical protein
MRVGKIYRGVLPRTCSTWRGYLCVLVYFSQYNIIIIMICNIYVNTYIHTYIRTYVHTYIHTYINIYIYITAQQYNEGKWYIYASTLSTMIDAPLLCIINEHAGCD